MKIFAKILKELRKENNMSQSEMAKLLHIKQQSYARYENDTAEPSYSTLVEISNIFDVSCDFLLGKKEF